MAAVNRPNPASTVCRARSEKREPKARPTSPPIRTAATLSRVPVTGTSALFGHHRGDPRAAVRHQDQKEADGRGAVQIAQELPVLDLAVVDKKRHPALGAADDGARQVEGASGDGLPPEQEPGGHLDFL